jgi:GDPmannose 4,6-dehydratase
VGLQSTIELGNLAARRDWGYAPEYVEAMWLMLQQSSPQDYVIGTGVSHSVKELVHTAFTHLGLNPDDHLRTDRDLLRPAEVDDLIADSTRARADLGWSAQTSFEDLVRLMVDADLERLRAERG